jgi:hypothetical protein
MALTLDQIARVCHEANCAYCLAIGDPAFSSWNTLDEGYRHSVRAGVKAAQEGATPRASHAAWMKERLSNGWAYGPVLDREAHVHPNLVPYDELPDAQKKKDEIFILLVSVLS